MKDVPFTQYLMPDGRKRQEFIPRSDEIYEMAMSLKESGFDCEIEMLFDYVTISMEVVNPHTEESLCCCVCKNGPEVPPNVDRMITQSFEHLKNMGQLKSAAGM